MFIGSFQISMDHIINDDFKDINKGLKPVNGEWYYDMLARIHKVLF